MFCHSSFLRVKVELQQFYHNHPHIQESHGLSHALAVYQHAQGAVEACSPPFAMEILLAALLHDVDDEKYFPTKSGSLPNATAILKNAHVPSQHWDRIYFMIHQVSCSKHGNRIPESIQTSGEYHWLIPRWADRVEAVGLRGALRCYQYTKEQQRPLWSHQSPRPQTEAEVWTFATPDRFQAYQDRGGTSEDMISHYYDKLLHIARPPAELVRNSYLEMKMRDSSQVLVDICLQYGRQGTIDEYYFQNLEQICS